MFKNVIISLLASIMIASHDACAYCRGAMLIGMFAVCFVLVSIIEDRYEQYCIRINRRKRLSRRLQNLCKEK